MAITRNLQDIKGKVFEADWGGKSLVSLIKDPVNDNWWFRRVDKSGNFISGVENQISISRSDIMYFLVKERSDITVKGEGKIESLDVESLIDEQLTKMEEYYPKSGDRVEATFVGSNPEYKGKHFTDKVVSIGNDSLVSYTTVTFEKEGQIKDGGDWNFVKV